MSKKRKRRGKLSWRSKRANHGSKPTRGEAGAGTKTLTKIYLGQRCVLKYGLEQAFR